VGRPEEPCTAKGSLRPFSSRSSPGSRQLSDSSNAHSKHIQ
jgi:hypothetical protein